MKKEFLDLLVRLFYGCKGSGNTSKTCSDVEKSALTWIAAGWGECLIGRKVQNIADFCFLNLWQRQKIRAKTRKPEPLRKEQPRKAFPLKKPGTMAKPRS